MGKLSNILGNDGNHRLHQAWATYLPAGSGAKSPAASVLSHAWCSRWLPSLPKMAVSLFIVCVSVLYWIRVINDLPGGCNRWAFFVAGRSFAVRRTIWMTQRKMGLYHRPVLPALRVGGQPSAIQVSIAGRDQRTREPSRTGAGIRPASESR